MLRKTTGLLLAALPALPIPLGTSVSAAPSAGKDCPAPIYWPGESRSELFLNICGPGKVIRGVNYDYEVVLTSKASHRAIKLTVIHEEPITRSSIPYSHGLRPDYAIWTIKNFKQGQIFRVSFRLSFRQHNDPKGSNFMVGARAYGPPTGQGGFLSKDVTFIKKPTSASGCTRAGAMKTVFPKAHAVGFNAQSPIHRSTSRRAPLWPGWCSDWRTTYADLPDQTLRPNRAFAQVRVSLYKTHRAALVALDEPAYGPMLRLPGGALTRTLVSSPSVNGDATREVGGVASVVGNVFISSVGQGRPPAHRGSEAVRAQMRIHRRIQAAVLALG